MKSRGALPVCFLIAVLVLYFREALFTEKVLYFRDLFTLFVPARRLITNLVSQGIPPWWNPYLFSGVPLAADVVHGIFYPLSAGFYVLPIHWAFKSFVVGHYLIAGVTFYILMRQWQIPSFAATFGAVAYMLSGYLLSLSNVLNFLPGAAWLPLAMVSFLKAMEPGGWRWILPTGLVMGLQAVTDPQSVYFSVCLMGLWPVLPGEKRWARGCMRTLGVVGAAGVTVILLAAVQLLPLLELLPQSIRSDGVSLAASTTWSFRPFRLAQFLAPDVYGDMVRGTYWGWLFDKEWGSATPWLLSAYMGVAPLVLAFFAIVSSWRDRRVRFGAVLFLVSLLLAVGDSTPFYTLLYKFLPLFRLFRFPSKWLLLATWALPALAAIGLARLAERRPGDTRLTRRFLGAALVVGLGLAVGLLIINLRPELAINLLTPNIPPSDVPSVASYIQARILFAGLWAVGLLLGTVFLLYAMLEGRMAAILGQGALLILLTGDLAVHNRHLIPVGPRELLEGEPLLARVLKGDSDFFRIYRLSTQEEDREFIVEGRKSIFDLALYRWRRDTLVSNTAMNHGLFDPWGSSAVRLKDYEQIYEAMGKNPLNLRLLGAWNVKYLIVPAAELPHPLLEPVPIPGGDPRIHLYRNLDFLPRAFWVSTGRWVEDRQQLLTLLVNVDPSQEVLLEGVGEQPGDPGGPPNQVGQAQILSYKPHEVVVRCEAPGPGYLVLSDTYYPGWRASVDGRDRPILRANYAMRAVQLDAGLHEVRFRYEPSSVRFGGIISLLALVGVGGGMIATFWQRR